MTYKAEQFKSPDLEIKGYSITRLIDNLTRDLTDPVLAKHGVVADEIDPEGWYPGQIMQDIFYEIYQGPGGIQALIAMGKASAPNLLAVIGAETIEDWLNNFNRAVTIDFRPLPDGYGTIVEKLGERHYRLTNNTSIPNDFAYGYLWEALRILKKPGEGAVIEIKWGMGV